MNSTLPIDPTQLKTIIAIASGFLTLLGSFFALWKKVSSDRSKNKEKKEEFIRSSIDRFVDDSNFSGFLKNLDKQNTIEEITGLRVRAEENKPLFDYYNTGIASFREIKRAWNYRIIDTVEGTTALLFKLPPSAYVRIYMGRIASMLAFGLSFAGFVCVVVFPKEYTLQFLAMSLTMIPVSVLPVYLQSEELTANRLIKRGKKKHNKTLERNSEPLRDSESLS